MFPYTAWWQTYLIPVAGREPEGNVSRPSAGFNASTGEATTPPLDVDKLRFFSSAITSRHGYRGREEVGDESSNPGTVFDHREPPFLWVGLPLQHR